MKQLSLMQITTEWCNMTEIPEFKEIFYNIRVIQK